MNFENNAEQKIILVNRTNLELTGIRDVIAFTEAIIEAEYADGCVAVEGSDLKIVDFSAQTGSLNITGTVDGIYYYGNARRNKKGLLRR